MGYAAQYTHCYFRALPVTIDEETDLDEDRRNHDLEVQRAIDAANAASKDTYIVDIAASRQDYRDILEAMRFMRQINPHYGALGRRLDKLAQRLRDGLDRKGAP
jgi:hypothetical protein